MLKLQRDELKKALHEGLVQVDFYKKDGTFREMECTLSSVYIPDNELPMGDKIVKPNPDVLKVYSLEDGWRSFRYDSVSTWYTIEQASNQSTGNFKEIEFKISVLMDTIEDAKIQLQELLNDLQSLRSKDSE